MLDRVGMDIGAYGGEAETPYLDRLAARGRRFDRAYGQYPSLVPSRLSILTGGRPERTRLWDEIAARDALGDAVPLPEAFHARGYFTARVGRVVGGASDASFLWDRVDEPGPEVVGKRAQEVLAERPDRPLFLAVSFEFGDPRRLPPAEFVEAYDPRRIRLPPPVNPDRPAPARPRGRGRVAARARAACPKSSAAGSGWRRSPASRRSTPRWAGSWTRWTARGLGERTVVVVVGDTAASLGEARRDVLFEEALRAALIVAGPGVGAPGEPVDEVVELVDLYPTLAELASLAPAEGARREEPRPLFAASGAVPAPASPSPPPAARRERWARACAASATGTRSGPTEAASSSTTRAIPASPRTSREPRSTRKRSRRWSGSWMRGRPPPRRPRRRRRRRRMSRRRSGQRPPDPGRRPRPPARLLRHGRAHARPRPPRPRGPALRPRLLPGLVLQPVAHVDPHRAAPREDRRPRQPAVAPRAAQGRGAAAGALPRERLLHGARGQGLPRPVRGPVRVGRRGAHALPARGRGERAGAAPRAAGPGGPSLAWTATANDDEDEPDGRAARRVVRLLEERRKAPFFIAVGFNKPHIPWVAPSRYFSENPRGQGDAARRAGRGLEGRARDRGVAAAAASRRAPPRSTAGGPRRRAASPGRRRLRRLRVVRGRADRAPAGGARPAGASASARSWWSSATTATTWATRAGSGARTRSTRRRCACPCSSRRPACASPARRRRGSSSSWTSTRPSRTSPRCPRLPASTGRASGRLLEDPQRSLRKAAFSVAPRRPPELGRTVRTARWRYTLWPDGGEELYDLAPGTWSRVRALFGGAEPRHGQPRRPRPPRRDRRGAEEALRRSRRPLSRSPPRPRRERG